MEDEDYASIGFMFDAEKSKVSLKFDFGEYGLISLQSVGTDPGHLQSGHYLWPAAHSGALHLLGNWKIITHCIFSGMDAVDSSVMSNRDAEQSLRPDATLEASFSLSSVSSHTSNTISSVLELGAGCGLIGLICTRLQGVERVIITDYDFGCINIIDQNIATNVPPTKTGVEEQSHLKGKDSSELNRIEVVCRSQRFKWGESISHMEDMHCDLIVGSDLLYSVDICEPLFTTVNDLLTGRQSMFVLITSFDIGKVGSLLIALSLKSYSS